MTAPAGYAVQPALTGLYRKVQGEKRMGAMGRAKAKLGSGARFASLKSKLASEPGVRDPGAVAASIGRKKYGKAKFQSLAAHGTPGY